MIERREAHLSTDVPRTRETVYGWISRNGVLFYQTQGRFSDREFPCDCCGQIIRANLLHYVWQSYHEAVGVVALCGYCDHVALLFVGEMVTKLSAIVHESEKHDSSNE